MALDTEADSLHAYPEKLCLIQISVEGEDALVDPLARMDLEPVLEELRHHELIMHGADYDLRLLRKGLNFVPTAIFDTMLASRLLGIREFGLNNLVWRFLNVRLEKGPQKANWAPRPPNACTGKRTAATASRACPKPSKWWKWAKTKSRRCTRRNPAAPPNASCRGGGAR